jgi:O-antigen/teichoic acid export membrane protein
MNSLKSASVTTLSRMIVVAVVNAISILLIANILGPNDNAQYTIAITIGHGISQVLNLGIGTSLIYFIKSGEITTRQATKLAIVACVCLFLVSCGLTFSVGIRYLPNVFPGISPNLILLGALCGPLILTHNLISNIFLAAEKFTVFNLLSTTPTILNFLFLSWFLFTAHPSVDFVISLTLSAFLFSCGLLVLTSLKMFGTESVQYKKDFVILKGLAKFGLPVLAANLIAFLNYKADLAIVNYVLGTQYAGIYAVSVFLSESLGYISSAIATAILPKMIGDFATEDRNTSRNEIIFRHTFYMSLITGLIIWTLFCAASYSFMPLYKQSVLPAAILMMGTVIISPFRILSAEIIAIGKPSINAFASLGGLCVTMVFSSFLAKKCGIIGAAIGSIMGYWSLAGVLFLYHRKVFKTPWSLLALNPISDVRSMLLYIKSSMIK